MIEPAIEPANPNQEPEPERAINRDPETPETAEVIQVIDHQDVFSVVRAMGWSEPRFRLGLHFSERQIRAGERLAAWFRVGQSDERIPLFNRIDVTPPDTTRPYHGVPVGMLGDLARLRRIVRMLAEIAAMFETENAFASLHEKDIEAMITNVDRAAAAARNATANLDRAIAKHRVMGGGDERPGHVE
jgi:hypothetical protein